VTKFLYFRGRTHTVLPLLFFYISLSARKSFYILTISLSYHHCSRADFCHIPRRRLFNFSRKAAWISTFRLAAFFSRVYHRGPTFPVVAFWPSATISPRPNIYEMRRPAPRRLPDVFGHFSSSRSKLKRHTRVSSTLSDVYVS